MRHSARGGRYELHRSERFGGSNPHDIDVVGWSCDSRCFRDRSRSDHESPRGRKCRPVGHALHQHRLGGMMSMPKKFWTILTVLLLVVVGAAVFTFKEVNYQRENPKRPIVPIAYRRA